MVYYNIDSSYRDRTLYPSPYDFGISLNAESSGLPTTSDATIYPPTTSLLAFAFPVASPNPYVLHIEPLN
jgi:hypothetical protein